jgi:PPOX class probable F420-dependent enzyme
MSFDHLKHEKYISLVTFRKDGTAVATPVWFAEREGRLYVMTRGDSGKVKRLRRDPRVRVAPSTIRGSVTGEAVEATARVLPENEWTVPKALIRKKYFFARLPIWSPKNIYLEIKPE